MFRYTIRDIFWLTVVVALAVLWVGEAQQRRSENQEIYAENVRLLKELDKALILQNAQHEFQSSPRFNGMMNKAQQRVLSRLNEDRKRRG